MPTNKQVEKQIETQLQPVSLTEALAEVEADRRKDEARLIAREVLSNRDKQIELVRALNRQVKAARNYLKGMNVAISDYETSGDREVLEKAGLLNATKALPLPTGTRPYKR